MKVGILTFHFTDNVGSALQAYALQQRVRSLGMDCEIINYQKQGWKQQRYNTYLPHFQKMFGKKIGKIGFLCFKPIFEARLNKFKKFQNQHLNYNNKMIVSKSELTSLLDTYDKFIVGSDQIWNLDNIKVDGTYFLDFVSDKNKKVAYAASLGVAELKPEHKQTVAKWLNDFLFERISVREEQGAKIIGKLLGKAPMLVLDPTLLLSQSDWSNVALIPKYKGYIFLYLRTISPTIAAFAEKLSIDTGLPIVQVTGVRRRTKTGRRVKNPDPAQWLGYMLNADYIITNSFHGIAFSINFNKQFFVEPLKGDQDTTNSRIMNILEQFDLSDRVIGKHTDTTMLIDYAGINKKLNEKRIESNEWLKNALEI